jgi:hypothetical protein
VAQNGNPIITLTLVYLCGIIATKYQGRHARVRAAPMDQIRPLTP